MTIRNRPLLTLVILWGAWAVIILGFQTLVSERVEPLRPDFSREWTAEYTLKNSNDGHIYLTEPFMNRQVAWDSEYYLSIAVAGYDDTNSPFVRLRSGQKLPLNYAFFPLYPLAAGALTAPLHALDLTPVAAATLAGVIISLLGTLAGTISLYYLAHDQLEESGALRAAFYLLAFPTGFFLAQVYTEGLFVGLAFACLALIQHKRLLLAGICAALAVWTRAVGLALVIPLALAWLSSIDWRGLRTDWRGALRPYRGVIFGLIGVLLPIGAYLIWQHFLGKNFTTVEQNWFGRKLFDFEGTQSGWARAFEAIAHSNFQMRIYYLLELASVLLALVACLFTLRRYPGVALFGLLALAVSVFAGAPQSLIRYVLVIPSIYLFLGRLGKNASFDRAWTLISVLMMGMLLFLFTFDMWVA